MSDRTESLRRAMVGVLNTMGAEETEQESRERLEASWGVDNVWDTKELTSQFEVLSFLAPFVHVLRRKDHVKGVMMFQHSPRFYFDFVEDRR